MAEKLPNMVPKWAQVGAMLGSKIVLSGSKSEKKRHRKRDRKQVQKREAPGTAALPQRGATPSQNGLPRGLGGYLAKAK